MTPVTYGIQVTYCNWRIAVVYAKDLPNLYNQRYRLMTEPKRLPYDMESSSCSALRIALTMLCF